MTDRQVVRCWSCAAGALLAVGLVVLLCSLTVFKTSNNDLWIHLKTGQLIVEAGRLPATDPYSFTAGGREYVLHEWLSQVVFHLVYRFGGVSGLIVFKAAVLFATCGALAAVCFVLRVRPILSGLSIGFMAFLGSARFVERPHIFSYLFLALYLLCYFAFRERGRRRAWLCAIPLLNVLWANLHGAFVMGIGLLLVLALAEAVAHLRDRRLGRCPSLTLQPRELALVAALPFACVVTALINPLGCRLLLFPFELPAKRVFLATIYEWMPLLHPAIARTLPFVYYMIWIALLVGAFFVAPRSSEQRPGGRRLALVLNGGLALLWAALVARLAVAHHASAPPPHPRAEALLWAAAAGLFVVVNFRRLELHHAAVVALFIALSFRSSRSLVDAAVATLPTMAHNANLVVDSVRRHLPRPPRWLGPAALASAGAALLALGVFTFQRSYWLALDPPLKREQGLGVAKSIPQGAVDYLTRNRIGGNVFASLTYAAQVIFGAWPEAKVAMDSRLDVYGEQLYQEYSQALMGGPALRAYLRRWPVDVFLINYSKTRAPEFHQTLRRSGEWTLVYFDDLAVVYLRRLPKFRTIVERDGYRWLDPTRPDPGIPDRADAHLFLQEAERAVAVAPEAWRAWRHKALALIALGRFTEAEVCERRILEIEPGAAVAWADLGNLYLLMNQGDRAAEAFRACLELCPDCTRCRVGREQAP